MDDLKQKAKILVVDDEEDICEILQYNLEKAGYEVKTVLSAEDALSLLSSERIDLILLDIMLGGISGLKFAKLLREDFKSSIPVVFVTALDSEEDMLKGFSTGGDDYITKPFSVNEVVARVGAVLSRAGWKIKPEVQSNLSSWKRAVTPQDQSVPIAEKEEDILSEFDFGILKINALENRVEVEGVEVFLTRKEMDILMLLARSAGKVYSRQEILKQVWKDEGFILERTVDVHIARLRKKLGKAGELIHNRSGFGYTIHPVRVEKGK